MKILFRDKEFVAVHKPSGVPVYSDPNAREEGAQDLLKESLGRPVFPVHRLDKGTCGILVFAFRSESAARLQKLFSSKQVEKTYWAVVLGEAPEGGKITEPLAGNKEKEKKPALTYFKRRGILHLRLDDETPYVLSFLELNPHTGRFHQIRRHLKHIGFPIVGDPDYGPIGVQKKVQRKLGTQRILLSSVRLSFRHPFHQKIVEVSSTPQDDMAKVIRLFQKG
ncbi:MAG: hypothetical protein JNL01_08820 [Bdellovibrionales bacterium]|nr:hypothetical protein [Bdellovibrionales bacterium]